MIRTNAVDLAQNVVTRSSCNGMAGARILMVSPRYFPHMGGVQTHVYEVATRLARSGADVTVLTTDVTGKLPATEEREGVRIRRVRAWPSGQDYFFAPGVYSTIVQGEWDLVHCQGCHTFVPPIAMLAARRARIPYIVTFHTGGHSSSVRHRLRRIHWKMIGPLLSRAAALVAVSNFEAELFRTQLNLSAERVKVIPNGARVIDIPGRIDLNVDPALIVSVGRLERYKGHHRVIAALPLVKEHVPDVRLRIVGSGPYESTLRRMAFELGVSDRVDIGAIAPEDRQGMMTLLSEAALVTLLSDYEAHPISVLEALALRKPVLVAETSGLQELASRDLATSIPADSGPDLVAQAIVAQLRSPHIADGVELPTWDACVADLVSIYTEAVKAVRCGF